jgi:hypothetical protein
LLKTQKVFVTEAKNNWQRFYLSSFAGVNNSLATLLHRENEHFSVPP